MHIIDWVVLALIALLAFLAIRHIRKKKGCCGCESGCGACPYSGSCEKKQQEQK